MCLWNGKRLQTGAYNQCISSNLQTEVLEQEDAGRKTLDFSSLPEENLFSRCGTIPMQREVELYFRDQLREARGIALRTRKLLSK